ncbi:hypothetical protein DAEQUDRAFT_161455 [Daedalea quercina L-15889]|uniref:Uncharacterized protein n=1 Tax=Daedalea quercina L-15889 TaxID=1314783 RepID=A0A165KKM9_9APHY|nr:hypothetical protein DAEQUDRAFT_161455 [Daedalea quercina L-15889]
MPPLPTRASGGSGGSSGVAGGRVAGCCVMYLEQGPIRRRGVCLAGEGAAAACRRFRYGASGRSSTPYVYRRLGNNGDANGARRDVIRSGVLHTRSSGMPACLFDLLRLPTPFFGRRIHSPCSSTVAASLPNYACPPAATITRRPPNIARTPIDILAFFGPAVLHTHHGCRATLEPRIRAERSSRIMGSPSSVRSETTRSARRLVGVRHRKLTMSENGAPRVY